MSRWRSSLELGRVDRLRRDDEEAFSGLERDRRAVLVHFLRAEAVQSVGSDSERSEDEIELRLTEGGLVDALDESRDPVGGYEYLGLIRTDGRK